MSAKILNALRKKAYRFAMEERPDEAREALEQIKIVEDQMKKSEQKKIGLETVTTADTLTERPVLDLVAQRLQKEQELLKVQADRAKKFKNKGVNDPYYQRYNEESLFKGANTYDDYQKMIKSYAMREANVLGSHPDHKHRPYEFRLEMATNAFNRAADKDILNKNLYINYGGRDLDSVGGYTSNSPKELQDQENFNIYADDLLANFKAGNNVIPYKGNDGLVYTNVDEINRVKQVEEIEYREGLRMAEENRLATLKANELAASIKEQKYTKKAKTSNYDPTLKTDFIKGDTNYKNKVYNRLKKGTYIKRDFNGKPILDENGNIQVLDWTKQGDLLEINVQREKDMKTPPGVKKLIYIPPKIPNLEKGHELMKTRRLAILDADDKVNLKQIQYPTFFTTEPRNKIHIRLETDLVKVLDGIKDLSSTLLRSADSKKMLKKLEKTRDAIVKDMKILGLESRILNEKNGKFRAYGQAFYDSGQLINSLKGIKKFNYIGSNLDLDPSKMNRNIKNVDGEFVLPDGFEDGGFASFEEVLEYNNE